MNFHQLLISVVRQSLFNSSLQKCNINIMFSLGNKIDLCGRDSNIFGIHLKKHNICDFKGLNTPGTSKSRKGVRMQHLVSVNA